MWVTKSFKFLVDIKEKILTRSKRRKKYRTPIASVSKLPNMSAQSMVFIISIQIIVLTAAGAYAEVRYDDASWEYRLKRSLLLNYDPTTRPVRNDSDTIFVRIGISLYHILDTDEKFQTIQTLLFVRLHWNDSYLTWNESDWGNITKVWIPINYLWKPDVAMDNNADAASNEKSEKGNAIVGSDGSVLYMAQSVAKTYCTLNVRYFPFDMQSCPIKFVSWTYSGLEVDLDKEIQDNYSYYSEVNQEWSVLNITANRNVKIYACCPDPYPDVTFTLNLRRRSTFYIFNLIFPCLLIYSLSFSVFFIPVEANEKVTMEVTVLLATMVFLMVINDTLPPTPDTIPLLGLLFSIITLIISIAVLMSVGITNIYYRKDGKRRVPFWIRRVFLKRWLPPDQFKSAPISKHICTEEFQRNADTAHGASVKANGTLVPWQQESDTVHRQCEEEGIAELLTCTCKNHNRLKPDDDMKQAIQIEQFQEEWKLLADKLDIFFFWVLFITGGGILLMLFCSIPNIEQSS